MTENEVTDGLIAKLDLRGHFLEFDFSYRKYNSWCFARL